MITIKEIAKLAGVSIGTVDRVIHGRGRFSEETAKKVKKIIAEHGYVPNIHASNLSLSRKHLFSVLMPNTHQDNGFWQSSNDGIERAKQELAVFQIEIKKYHFDRYSSSDFEKKAAEMLDHEPDGFLMAPVLAEEGMRFCKNVPESVQYVLFDTPLPGTRSLSFIGQNSKISGQLCARLLSYLVLRGKKIAAIQVGESDLHIKERIEGFCSYFSEDDRPKILKIINPDNKQEQKELLEAVCDERDSLEGIFVSNADVQQLANQLADRGIKKHIVAYDLIPENKKLLEQGKVDFLISQRPGQQVYLGLKQLYRHFILKESIENEIMMPIDILTKENVDFY